MNIKEFKKKQHKGQELQYRWEYNSQFKEDNLMKNIVEYPFLIYMVLITYQILYQTIFFTINPF